MHVSPHPPPSPANKFLTHEDCISFRTCDCIHNKHCFKTRRMKLYKVNYKVHYKILSFWMQEIHNFDKNSSQETRKIYSSEASETQNFPPRPPLVEPPFPANSNLLPTPLCLIFYIGYKSVSSRGTHGLWTSTFTLFDFENILRSTFEHSQLNLKRRSLVSIRNPMLESRRREGGRRLRGGGGGGLENFNGKCLKSARNYPKSITNFEMMWLHGIIGI
jgi:hypothetical protein